MNTFAAFMLLLWVSGWTIAFIRAGLKTRFVYCPGRREACAGFLIK
jgi:hypothetical protein